MKPTFATIDIKELSHDGRGIGNIEGKTVFVDNTLPEETVKIQYTKRHTKYDEAKTVEILVRSPLRVEPMCQYFGICGGCDLQHLAHAAQLQFKERHFLEQLKHFGKIEPKKLLSPLIAHDQNYRHKARLSVKYIIKKQQLAVGFREKGSHFVTAIDKCPILAKPVDQLLKPLQTLIAELSNYQEIPQIEIAVGDNGPALVIRHLKPFTEDDQALLQTFALQYNVRLFLQPSGLDSIHLFAPSDADVAIEYQILDLNLRYRFGPTDFAQINKLLNEKMLAQAINLLDPQPNEKILDLFCGFGNFTLAFAKQCESIIGVEGSTQAVLLGKQNSALNHVTNAQFYCADLNSDVNGVPWMQARYDKIILDPPRTGAEAMIPVLGKLKAQQVLYISCNPATLARDGGMLCEQFGYTLVKAGIMDMFPHTKHVEAMALFTL